MKLGQKHTMESRAKMTESQTGLSRGALSEERKKQISKSLTGNTFSNESKAKMSKNSVCSSHNEHHQRTCHKHGKTMSLPLFSRWHSHCIQPK